MSTTITAPLLEDARAMHAGINDAVVMLMLDNERGFPCEVRYLIGSTNADHLRAAELAALMRRGNPVRAECEYIAPVTDHGFARLAMRGLLSLEVNGTKFK